jgi:hypothetical protein
MEADLTVPIYVSPKKLILIGKLNFKIVMWGCRGDGRILFNHSFSHGYVTSKPEMSKHITPALKAIEGKYQTSHSSREITSDSV